MLLFPVRKSNVSSFMSTLDNRLANTLESKTKKYAFNFAKDKPIQSTNEFSQENKDADLSPKISNFLDAFSNDVEKFRTATDKDDFVNPK
jgi:hypothetical protein